MKARQDIADLLRAGATYAQIRQQLGVNRNLIASTRKALRIPVPRARTWHRTAEESFALYATPYGDGHTRWDGPMAGRMPQIWADGRAHSALRVAFQIRHGREPVGNVKPGCDEGTCIAPDHVVDRPMRERLKTTYDAIFGQTP